MVAVLRPNSLCCNTVQLVCDWLSDQPSMNLKRVPEIGNSRVALAASLKFICKSVESDCGKLARYMSVIF
jgi:hypothetical protein